MVAPHNYFKNTNGIVTTEHINELIATHKRIEINCNREKKNYFLFF